MQMDVQFGTSQVCRRRSRDEAALFYFRSVQFGRARVLWLRKDTQIETGGRGQAIDQVPPPLMKRKLTYRSYLNVEGQGRKSLWRCSCCPCASGIPPLSSVALLELRIQYLKLEMMFRSKIPKIFFLFFFLLFHKRSSRPAQTEKVLSP